MNEIKMKFTEDRMRLEKWANYREDPEYIEMDKEINRLQELEDEAFSKLDQKYADKSLKAIGTGATIGAGLGGLMGAGIGASSVKNKVGKVALGLAGAVPGVAVGSIAGMVGAAPLAGHYGEKFRKANGEPYEVYDKLSKDRMKIQNKSDAYVMNNYPELYY